MFKIMKYLIFIILIYFYDYLLGVLIFDRLDPDIMWILLSTILATVLSIISTYYLIRLINDLLGL